MAVMDRKEISVKETEHKFIIANDPKARLMYYLDCMCAVIDFSDTANLTKLRNYSQYYTLTETETDALVSLCFLLSPDKLNGKIIFQDDSMCGHSDNNFFEISDVQDNLLLSDSIIIGGQRRHVSKIMAFKQQWLITNWIIPMKHFLPRLLMIASGAAATEASGAVECNSMSASSGCCTIL